jgi:hypothetical protein
VAEFKDAHRHMCERRFAAERPSVIFVRAKHLVSLTTLETGDHGRLRFGGKAMCVHGLCFQFVWYISLDRGRAPPLIVAGAGGLRLSQTARMVLLICTIQSVLLDAGV